MKQGGLGWDLPCAAGVGDPLVAPPTLPFSGQNCSEEQLPPPPRSQYHAHPCGGTIGTAPGSPTLVPHPTPALSAMLTPTKAPHGVGEAIVLVDFTLARVLVNDAQVLVPVRPVHLVHPGREKQSGVFFGGGGLLHCFLPHP